MRIRSAVVTGLGSLALFVAGIVGLSNPAQAESQNVTVSCVAGAPAYSTNNLVAAPGDTIRLLNGTGGILYVSHVSGINVSAGWWPNTATNVLTVASSSGGYIQVSGGGVNPCGGLGTLLTFRAPGTAECVRGSDCRGDGGSGGTSSGVGILGSLEGLVVKAEHFSELAMKADVALLAATTEEAAIAAAKKAIIYEKAALRASEKVLQGLTRPTQPSR